MSRNIKTIIGLALTVVIALCMSINAGVKATESNLSVIEHRVRLSCMSSFIMTGRYPSTGEELQERYCCVIPDGYELMYVADSRNLYPRVAIVEVSR